MMGAVMGATTGLAFAGDWRLNPTLQLAATYTDNVALVSNRGNEQDIFVGQINPGVTLNGHGARVRADLGYQMQNMVYLGQSDYNATYHRLWTDATAELARDKFFIDAHGSIDQQAPNALNGVSLNNLNPGNITTVGTYGVSPYFRLHAGEWVQGELRYGYDSVEYSGNADNLNISNSTTNTYSAALASGHAFSRLGWNLNYRDQDQERDNGNKSKRESASAEIRYRLDQQLSLLARGGHEHNHLVTNSDVGNGSYWSAGGAWNPSRHWFVEATAGEHNRDAMLSIVPSTRTSLKVNYQDRSVGLNTGKSWAVDLSQRIRRVTTRLTYTEENTNEQLLSFSGREFFYLIDAEGKPVLDPATGLPRILAVNVFSLTNQEFLQKRAQASMQLKTGRSDAVFALFHERREFGLISSAAEVLGTNASWDWKFAPHTESRLTGAWQHVNYESSGREDRLWSLDAGVTRRVTPRTNGALDFLHQARESNDANQGYRENRITMSVTMRF